MEKREKETLLQKTDMLEPCSVRVDHSGKGILWEREEEGGGRQNNRPTAIGEPILLKAPDWVPPCKLGWGCFETLAGVASRGVSQQRGPWCDDVHLGSFQVLHPPLPLSFSQ